MEEAKQAYSDFLRKRVKEGGDELKLREASSFAQKQTPLTPYELKDFVIRNAEEYLHTYANRRAKPMHETLIRILFASLVYILEIRLYF
jgi:hypothetical protein